MASLRNKRRKQCDGKVRHESQRFAIVSLLKSKREDMHPYKCQFCGGWHVGHRQNVANAERWKR